MFSLKLENEFGNVKNIHDGESYIVLDVTGLNPPSATHYTSKSYNRHGVKYNGYSIDERTLTITVKLLGDIELNRNALYDWIESGQYVKIYYSNGVRDVYCEGHIVEPDVTPFTEDEQVVIEIMCADPYFKALETIVTEVTNVIPTFYLTEEDDDIYFATDDVGVPFSEELDTNVTKITNKGSESGVVITIVALEDVSNLAIYNTDNPAKEYIKLKNGEMLLKGQTLTIDTTGTRYKIEIDGENALSKFDRNMTWFTLKKGTNSFYTEPAFNLRTTIEYNERYLGV